MSHLLQRENSIISYLRRALAEMLACAAFVLRPLWVTFQPALETRGMLHFTRRAPHMPGTRSVCACARVSARWFRLPITAC